MIEIKNAEEKMQLLAAVLFLFILGTLVFYGLGLALLPLIFSFVLAYLLFPFIRYLEKRGVNRKLAVVAVFLIATLLIIWGLWFMLPIIWEDAKAFLTELPDNIRVLIAELDNLGGRFGLNLDLQKQEIIAELNASISKELSQIASTATNYVGKVINNFVYFVIILANIFLVPFFFYYIVSDYESIIQRCKELFPPKLRRKVDSYFVDVDKILSGFIRGQLTVGAILACMYGFGLWIVGIKFALLIGIVAGFLNVIPYLGFIIGFGSALLIAISEFSFAHMLGVTIVFSVSQLVEGYLLTPKIVGDKVGLSVLLTIIAVIVGGNLFGIIGMLFAVPVAAILKIVTSDVFSFYKKSSVYKTLG